jgi:Ala-tRNA(Pro) deacylase
MFDRLGSGGPLSIGKGIPMKLDAFLESQKVAFERLAHHPTYTAQGLAAEEHVPGMSVAKPVLVLAGDQYVMCVLPACSRVNLDAVAKATRADRARLAKEDEMENVFPDCELGAEPPFGNLFGIQTLMDASLREDEYIVFQAGTHTDAIKMRRADYERIASPVVASFAHHL